MRSTGARCAVRAFVGAAAVLIAAGSCSSKDGTGPVTSYVGGWEGSTAAGGILRFYVESGGLPVTIIGMRIVGTQCTDSVTFTLHRESPDPLNPVIGDSLSVTLSSTQFVVTMAGHFTSATQASGTLAINSIRCTGSLSTTWSASKASAAGKDLTGTWTGAYSTSLVPSATITIVLAQSGSTLSGTYTSTNGATGTVSGTVAGKVGKFSLTQTTSQCAGTFTGHSALFYEGTGGDLLSLAWTGTDCLGTHTHAGGSVRRS